MEKFLSGSQAPSGVFLCTQAIGYATSGPPAGHRWRILDDRRFEVAGRHRYFFVIS
jgi:hypothetical protein